MADGGGTMGGSDPTPWGSSSGWPASQPAQPVQPAPAVSAPPGAYPAPWGGMGWWDGYQWSQLPMAPQYVDPYEPVRVLARAVQVLLGLLVALKVIAIAVDLAIYQDADALRGRSFDSYFEGSLGAAVGISLITILVTLATGITFLVWRFRIQKNLRGALGAAGLEYTPGWAVGWWFVPIANLWKPKQAMDEAWQASDPSSPVGTRGWAARAKNPLISWWWGTWILSYLVAIDFRVSTSDGIVTTDELRFRLVQEIISFGLSALAAYLALQVVGEITDRHRRRARAFGIED